MSYEIKLPTKVEYLMSPEFWPHIVRTDILETVYPNLAQIEIDHSPGFVYSGPSSTVIERPNHLELSSQARYAVEEARDGD